MKKYIYVHESMGRYWIDYRKKDQNHISTIMARTKKDVPNAIRNAKSDFSIMRGDLRCFL